MGPEKAKKKGLWSPDEDQMLRDYVVKNGHASWTSIPIHAGLQRSGKSCRLRWINYLRPGLKRGAFSKAEVDTILTLHQILGNKWSQIALHLPGRSDNEIKNYWHSCLKKRVAETTIVEEIQGLEVWNSYINSSLESCSSPESLEHGKGSVVERDECVQVQVQVQVQQRLSLPKVIFAEWLSFDEFNNHGLENNHSSNHEEDTLVDDLIKNGGGAFGAEKCSQDMLHSDSQLDYFPGEILCINYHDF